MVGMVVTDASPALMTDHLKPQLDPNIPVLYSTRMSPYCQRIRLILNAKKVAFQVVNVSIWSKPEWFVGMTPVNKLPVWHGPNGHVIYESVIIADYLEEIYCCRRYRRFLPVDPFQKAMQKLRVEHIMRLIEDPVRAVGMKQDLESGQALLDALSRVEELLMDNFFSGQEMGYVDLMIYPWFDRAPFYLKFVGIDWQEILDRVDRIMQWRERMLSDMAVRLTSYPEECWVALLEARRAKAMHADVALELQQNFLNKHKYTPSDSP
ncbi:hypothetical protein RvY_06303 [Ramazzottius varieornatus]|uniref:Glutathione S-transferase omega n=1 Tax=Ramazzottius varieornatus TaxID=947166 RepID=A0A1D1V7R8_RAMVA|nr:hypothetical protein RvY_06303 [Ramazzottius varieornatus]